MVNDSIRSFDSLRHTIDAIRQRLTSVSPTLVSSLTGYILVPFDWRAATGTLISIRSRDPSPPV